MTARPLTSAARPRRVTAVVVGAGHAGLAVSAELSARGIDHVVLERDAIASAWRARWESLRLLTPNWQCSLPGYRYTGPDPDGFMTKEEVARFIERYAGVIGAPVETNTTVASVIRREGGYRVETDRGEWLCRGVIAASGAFARPLVPREAAGLSPAILSLTCAEYRSPDALPNGGVLVVGASATGVQIADEIARSGRAVTLSVGEHVRMPRRYRGLDIQRWLELTGILDQRYDAVDDIVRARRVPSPQLVGTPEHATLDLNALTRIGVRLAGRFVGASGSRVTFSGSLRNHCTLADLKLKRLLDGIDVWVERNDAAVLDKPQPLAPTRVDPRPPLTLDCTRENVRTIVWATGFAPEHGWLHVDAFDHKGRLKHDGGVVAPGLYVMGLTFMRRRKSSFIHGAADDARDLCDHLKAHLDGARTGDPPMAQRRA
jgi:putative flavoprotein involved in K+ transport